MRNYFFSFFFMIFILSCSVKEPLVIGAKIQEKSEIIKAKNIILTPICDFIEAKKVKREGITYDLGINKDGIIVYISTNDKNFIVGGYKVGDSISTKIKETDIESACCCSWGYYIKINSDWYAGFDYKFPPNENSRIVWFFQYNMGDEIGSSEVYPENRILFDEILHKKSLIKYQFSD